MFEKSVINDVVSNVRESFLDEGVDENVLIELKNLWQQKLEASKAVDNTPQHSDASLLGNLKNTTNKLTIVNWKCFSRWYFCQVPV